MSLTLLYSLHLRKMITKHNVVESAYIFQKLLTKQSRFHRYIEIGFFQVGEPYLGEESHHGSHAHAAPSRLSSTLTLRTSDDTLRFRSKAPQIPSIPENRPSTSTSTESSNMSNTTVEEESEVARI